VNRKATVIAPALEPEECQAESRSDRQRLNRYYQRCTLSQLGEPESLNRTGPFIIRDARALLPKLCSNRQSTSNICERPSNPCSPAVPDPDAEGWHTTPRSDRVTLLDRF
jgi:hypothetical protein